jgi:hypothetical protein
MVHLQASDLTASSGSVFCSDGADAVSADSNNPRTWVGTHMRRAAGRSYNQQSAFINARWTVMISRVQAKPHSTTGRIQETRVLVRNVQRPEVVPNQVGFGRARTATR